MLEKFQYVNHMNETLDFGKGKLFANYNDLRDFTWTATSKNERISGFKRGIISKTIPIIIKCDLEEEGLALRNRLFEVMEKDVLTLQHGKIIVGDYSLKCFTVESKKTEYLLDKGYIKVSIKISTDFPYWTKETKTTFNYGSGTAGKNLDFERDFPYDYTSNLLDKQLNNTDFVPSNFKMVIYGICETPVITISGHKYKVSESVAVNEHITIDSIQKTVVLTHADGTKENIFNKRDKNSYIFEKIPAGVNNVSASGNFKFDIILFEERSEPKWT